MHSSHANKASRLISPPLICASNVQPPCYEVILLDSLTSLYDYGMIGQGRRGQSGGSGVSQYTLAERLPLSLAFPHMKLDAPELDIRTTTLACMC